MIKYWSLFSVSFKQAWSKKANLSGILFFLFILIFIYNRLWEVIAADSYTTGLNRTYIWYLLFAEMIILSNRHPIRHYGLLCKQADIILFYALC